MASPKFQYKHKIADIFRGMVSLNQDLANEVDNPMPAEVAQAINLLADRDRQLEDYLTSLVSGGGGSGYPIRLYSRGTSSVLTYLGSGLSLGFGGEVVEGWANPLNSNVVGDFGGFDASGNPHYYRLTYILSIGVTQATPITTSPHSFVAMSISGAGAAFQAPLELGSSIQVITLSLYYSGSLYGGVASPTVQFVTRQPNGSSVLSTNLNVSGTCLGILVEQIH